jgi:hypothetical protein
MNKCITYSDHLNAVRPAQIIRRSVQFVSNSYLQVNASLVIAEREFLLACCDELHRRANALIGGVNASEAIYKAGG